MPKPILKSPSPTKSLSPTKSIVSYQYEEIIDTLQPKVGLQHNLQRRKTPVEFRNSFNLNHPNLSKGQKYYLQDLCQIYSIKDMIHNKKQRYVDILELRKTTGE
jgi:hypothetical protein